MIETKKIIAIFVVLMMSGNIPGMLATNQDGTSDKSSNVMIEEVATPSMITIYFNDSYHDIMVLGNANYYEIGFNKSNGAIVYIKDKSTGENVTSGSFSGALWLAQFHDPSIPYWSDNGEKVSGSDYGSGLPNNFTYTWSNETHTLTFNYISDPGATGQLNVTITIVASDEHYFDMNLILTNNFGYTLKKLRFPNELVFTESEIEEVLVPGNPGCIFESGYFTGQDCNIQGELEYRTLEATHPSRASDLLAVRMMGGSFAIYTLWTSQSFSPVEFKLLHFEGLSEFARLLHYNFHPLWVTSGSSWSTPTVRIRISQGFKDVILANRADGPISEFQSVEEKLGNKFSTIIRSPLLSVDPIFLYENFSRLPEVFAELPTPAILMFSNYWTGDFHGHHPDYLPPNPKFGTTEDLQAAIKAAHDMGMLIMPFTLPVWWHENSSTVQNLTGPLTIANVSVHVDENGTLDYSYWELGERLDYGYWICPYHPFVQTRLQQMMEQMTVNLSSDLIYEDVLGAMDYGLDFNPAAPSDHMRYPGWLNHTRTYKNVGLITETGCDILAETMVGFMGSANIGREENRRAYPMTSLLMHDKVLFYQYWADVSVHKEDLAWNLAMGFMLNNVLIQEGVLGEGGYEPLGSPWEYVIADFQAHVVSRYAGKRMTDFIELPDNITESIFEDITVIRNWDKNASYDNGQYTLPSEGALVTSANGDLVAGIFTAYNNVSLSSGEHYLIEEHSANDIVIRQDLGENTSLTLKLLSGWTATDQIEVSAYARDGRLITTVPATVSTEGVTFMYENQIEGQDVAYHRVIKGGNYLPIANFTYMPEKPVVNEMITFNASNSTDPDGYITNYEWNFDDGNITNTTEPIITHSYSLAGNYTVNLTVTDDENATDSYSMEVTVSEELDLPPTAVILNPPTDITENSMNLSWSQNNDPDFANYTIYQSTTERLLGISIHIITDSTSTSYMVADLSPLTTYYFTVRVYNTAGQYNDSAQVSATTLAEAVGEVKPSEIPWLYIIISVVIIIALAATGIGIKRRKKAQPPVKTT